MKKRITRFFAMTLAMVMTMLLVSPTTAMAAELDESSVSNDDLAVVFVSDNGIIDIVPVDEDGNAEYVAAESVNSGYSESDPIYANTFRNQSTDDTISITRALPTSGYIVVKLEVSGSAKIKVNVRSNIFWATLYEDSATNGTSWKKSNGVANRGVNVEMIVTPLVNNTTYTLKLWLE